MTTKMSVSFMIAWQMERKRRIRNASFLLVFEVRAGVDNNTCPVRQAYNSRDERQPFQRYQKR